MPRPRDVPDRARVVIIGGGVGGTAIAYHLAQLGERDVVLVDRNELTSGSTFHSAGLVGQLRGSVTLTQMMMWSVELYRTLDCGWTECGGIRLACTPEREQETHRQVAWARTFGLPLELISADEARDLFPLMVTDGVRVASHLPTDGYLDPSMLTYALAEGAREGGCRVFTHTRVNGIDVRDGRVQSVDTEWGDDRVRGRRRRRRHVRGRDRADGRRPRADRSVRPRVPRHAAVSRPHRSAPPADAARPRQPHLLPRGGRRACHGRLRAPQRAVGARRAPARQRSHPTSTGACSRRTGRASRRSPTPPSAACR